MKTVSISGSLRANVGKKDAKALRVSKTIPCVLYGGNSQIHFSVAEPEFKNILYTPHACTVAINLDGTNYNAIVQEAQFHKVSDHLLHVDFLEIVNGKQVTMNIPVKTTGTSPGVRNGGKLVKKLKTLKIKAFADKMPDTIDIAIDKMEIGNSVRVAELKVEGLTFLNAPNVTVISVDTTRAAVAEAAASAPAAPAAKAAAPAAKAATPAKK